MEEKILITGEISNINRIKILRNLMCVLGVLFFIVSTWYGYTTIQSNMKSVYLSKYCDVGWFNLWWGALIVGVIIAMFGIIPYFSLVNVKLTVTNRRIYGTAAFGKRVDLPIDSISAVGTGIFNSIVIASSSGKISFAYIGNRDEIHKVISELIVKRQDNQKVISTTIKQEVPQSNADEIKKYKELLDSGVISQEEFDSKKKQLLGL